MYTGGTTAFPKGVPGNHATEVAYIRDVMDDVIGEHVTEGADRLLMVAPLTRGLLRLIGCWGYRRLSLVAMVLIVGIVAALTGPAGLLVMAAGTGIGLIPLLYGSRRMNGLGVILLPMACNLSGVGPAVAGWLRLL